MTDPEGNGELCFPETLNVFFGFASGKIAFEGKQNSLLPAGQVMKCFVIPPNSKLEKTMKKLFTLRWPAHKFNLPWFQGAVLTHSKRHVFLQSKNVFKLGVITKSFKPVENIRSLLKIAVV